MHIANGKTRDRALAGREAFQLDRREGVHPVAQIAAGAVVALPLRPAASRPVATTAPVPLGGVATPRHATATDESLP